MAHPIHVTITDAKHNTIDNTLEIVFRGFVDDFDDAVETKYDTIIGMDQDTFNLALADSLVALYFKDKLKIDINDNAVVLKYIGLEIENEFVWCYLKVDNIERIQKFDVVNLLMLEHFKDQTNMLHLDANGKVNSTFTGQGRTKDSFKFK